MTCPTCRVVDLSEIQLNVRNSEVTMRACVRCEKRWWERDGEPIALDEVLHLISPRLVVTA